MVKRVLVTGGCGFIGANLVPFLAAQGYLLRVVDNLSRGHRDFLNKGDVEFEQADIRDRDVMQQAARGVDAVIHLAAYGSVTESLVDAQTNFDINGRGTLTVLEAAREAGVQKFVFASTGGAIVGDAGLPVHENSVPRPKSPYGASKLTGEAYCQAYARSFGLPTVMLRFANIYGPFSAHKKGAITAFCKALLRDEPIVIYGDGAATRDFLHVDDLCTGIVGAIQGNLEPATVLHLATGSETSVLELAELLKKISGKAEHPVVFRNCREGEVLRNFADYHMAREMLGFVPRISLEEGVKRTWEWFVGQGQMVMQFEETDS